MQPLDLIATARRLAKAKGSRRPRQSDLKRAISTAYYAMFHAVCRLCADCMVGGTSASRSMPAWQQAYRALEHGHAKSQCKNKTMLAKFPKEVEDFASKFVTLQEKRHAADYDPRSRFSKTDVDAEIDAAEILIKGLASAPMKDRRAFAVWLVMKKRAD